METQTSNTDRHEVAYSKLEPIMIREQDIVDAPGYELDTNFSYHQIKADIGAEIEAYLDEDRQADPTSEAFGLIPLDYDEEGELYFESEARVIDLRLNSASTDQVFAFIDMLGALGEGHPLFGNKHTIVDGLMKRFLHAEQNSTMRRLEMAFQICAMVGHEYSGNFLSRLDEARVQRGLADPSIAISRMQEIQMKILERPNSDQLKNGYQLRLLDKVFWFMDGQGDEYSPGDKFLVQTFLRNCGFGMRHEDPAAISYCHDVVEEYLKSTELETCFEIGG